MHREIDIIDHMNATFGLNERYRIRTFLLFACSAATVGIATTAATPRIVDPPATASAPSAAATLQLDLTFDEAFRSQPYTGRVFVFTSRSRRGEPRMGPDWFRPAPMFAIDVKDWHPGKPLRFDDAAISFPTVLSRIDADGLRLQAVLPINPDAREPGTGAGNGISDVVELTPELIRAGPVRLHIHKPVRQRGFRGNDRVRPFELASRLLGKFHGRDVKLSGAVILPEEYAARSETRFPTLYIMPGFGQTARTAGFYTRPTGEGEVPLVHVLLDADCPTGNHVFADSANNGPYGTALVEELIPWLERQYRLIPEPTARFLTGHSSGGWASLWAQITHADYFGGVWATSPDPVDFRDFQQIDIYAPNANMFRDEQGRPRPLARVGDRVAIWYKDFSDMEEPLGAGGQLGSFEAVFSPRGPNGRPLKLWDRRGGAIDPAVAKAWEAYDIRLVLERDWDRLAPKLAGKLHVYTGAKDTFYLEGAVRKLKKSLKTLGSDADVRILKDHDHGSIMMAAAVRNIRRDLSARFRKHHPDAFPPTTTATAPNEKP